MTRPASTIRPGGAPPSSRVRRVPARSLPRVLAVLAITEAVVRLVPGVVGNAASLVEESHSDGLLEYPLYTRPAAWTGPDGTVREVPEVLLSGNHARIAAWRAEQSLARTAERRPDLIACREGAQQHGAGDAPDTAVSA